MGNTFEGVAEILADISELEVSEIKLESSLQNDLGIGSLMGLEIMVMIEKKFKIELEEKDLPMMLTPKDIIRIIDERRS